MDERTTGIILRTRLLTETSLIVQWLTPDLGRISTVAKGARRPKSPFRGKLDLFYVGDFSFGRSRKSELHNLREVVLRDTHSRLRESLGWIQQASYCAALIEQTTETETPLPNVFSLMSELLVQLPKAPPVATTVFAFELKILNELGLGPKIGDASLSAGAQQLAALLLRSGFETIARVKPSAAQAQEFRQFLHGFLIYHLDKIPRSRAAALNAE